MPDLNELLAAIEARAEAATPGPWKYRPTEKLAKWPGVSVNEIEAPRIDSCWIAKVLDHRNCIVTKPGDQNAAFIAAAREDVPRLCRLARFLETFVFTTDWQTATVWDVMKMRKKAVAILEGRG